MKSGVVYLTVESAIKEHDKALEVSGSGGAKGVLNEGLLKSSVEFIKHDGYYPGFINKLTHLMFSITMNHCFVDGNKRSAIAVSALFLSLNGYGGLVDAFIVEMENIVVCVARGILNKERLQEILEVFLELGEVDEATKVFILAEINKKD